MFHQDALPARPLARSETTQNLTLMLLAALLGFAVGGCIYVFDQMIELAHSIFAEGIAHNGIGAVLESLGLPGELALIPMLAGAGLIVGLIMQTAVGEEKLHGVAKIIESVAFTGGRLPYLKMPFKALASALSLGAGASVGPEDPSVQIGANLGSYIGQKLRVSEENLRLIVAAGAASAIAAAFNAPIAGVFFALEVILRDFTRGAFGVVVLAAVISSAFTQTVDLPSLSLGTLEFTAGSPVQLAFYVLLGLLLGPVSSLFIRTVYWQHELWHHYVRLPRPFRTMLAGALVGVVAMFLPQIMGPGKEVLRAVFSGEASFALHTLLALAAAKLLLTGVSIAGGFVGGVFAPTLFVGVMLGAAYGQILAALLPGMMSDTPESFAIAGMAGIMAGVVRAPIMAILLVFELTGSYQAILPMMLTTVICVFVVERIGPAGIYTLGLLRQGIHLQQGRDIDLMQGVLVSEIMQYPVPTINRSASLGLLRDELRHQHVRSLCVLDEDGLLYGVVTLSDLQNTYERIMDECSANGTDSARQMNNLTVGDICTQNVIYAYPDEVLLLAIRRMGEKDVGRLPVIKRGTRELVGVLRRHHIMQAYNLALSRKMQDQHLAEQVRLNTLTGAHVFEMRIARDSQICGKLIRELPWPPETVVASIQRKGRLVVPHGNTELKPDDVLTIVADPQAERVLERLFR